MPADPVAIACSIAGRPLPRPEWAQYVPADIELSHSFHKLPTTFLNGR
jgi:hypothetical protein